MSRKLLFLLLCAVPAHSQDLSAFTPILLPVHTSAPVAGAFGTQFSAGTPYVISEREQRWFPSGSDSLEPFGTLPAHAPRFLPLRGPGSFGRLVFFEDARVTFSHHLTSSTPDPAMGGITAVPIVRPEQFFSDELAILNVPLVTPRYRVKLVVYQLAPAPGEVHVELAFMGTGTLSSVIRQFELPVDRREGSDASYPYFADATLDERCVQVLPHLPCESWSGAVVIRPAVPGRYWALVALTDNSTQRVTFYYPQ